MKGAREPERHGVTVEKVIHRRAGTGFTVLEVVPDDGGLPFVAAGVVLLEVCPGEALILTGEFEDHPRFGRRFRLSAAYPKVPDSPEGIRRYLSSGRISGIGPKLAERLVARFGDDTIRILEEQPDRAAEVPGLGPRKLEQLRKSFAEGRDQRHALVFLQGLGLGPAVSLEIWRRLGLEAVARVKEDPYALCDLVTGVGFVTADRMAAASGIQGDHPARVRGALKHVLRGALDQGHMCLEAGDLIERAESLLQVDENAVRSGLDDEIREDRLRAVAPDLPEFDAPQQPLVYLPVLLETEREAVKRLLEIADTPRKGRPTLATAPSGRGPALTEEQERAVTLLLDSKVSCLTGGPGVGKTTVLRAVVTSFHAAGYVVALASPTGRAARRLSEATQFKAQTLHRLFGLIPGLERSVTNERLEADVLLVDEASMLDLPLLLRVLKKLRAATIVVFIGDPDQLPSVGPGRVLADLIASKRLPTARLTTIFRQESGSHIVANAHRILAGEMPQAASSASARDFFFMQRDTSQEGAELIEELFMRRLPAHYGVDPRTDIQVLAPMYRGVCGVTALNTRLQEALNGSAPGFEVGSRVFRQGDRIIQTRNDYDAGLMNGDLGVVRDADPERRTLVARFEGKDLPLSGAALDAVETAYALTVHKSQGGEFPVVLLSLFSDHSLMLKRNVLYTAVTRARRLMVIVGAETALRRAVRDDRLVQRKGGFLWLLQGHTLDSLDCAAPRRQN